MKLSSFGQFPVRRGLVRWKMAAAVTEELVKDREFGVLYLEFFKLDTMCLPLGEHTGIPSLLCTERLKQLSHATLKYHDVFSYT